MSSARLLNVQLSSTLLLLAILQIFEPKNVSASSMHSGQSPPPLIQLVADLAAIQTLSTTTSLIMQVDDGRKALTFGFLEFDWDPLQGGLPGFDTWPGPTR